MNSPNDLQHFQTQFLSAVSASDLPHELAANICAIGQLNSNEVVQLYRDDYRFRLTQTLGETFETCWCLLGDEDFFRLAEEYIRLTPSTTPNLSDFGASFPQFLAQQMGEEELVIEMANFEWSFWQLFHQAAPASTPLADLMPAGLSLEEALLRPWHLHEQLFFYRSQWQLWSMFCLRKEGFGERTLDDFASPEQGLLYRQDAHVKAALLPLPQWNVLCEIARAVPPASALTHVEGIDAAQVQQLFAFLASYPLVSSLT